MTAIRIKGHLFIISDPHQAGQTLTLGEAQALNQLRAENIRNNMAKEFGRLSGHPISDEDLGPFRQRLADYEKAYQFVERRAPASDGALEAQIKQTAAERGRSPTDPEVQAEAMRRLEAEREIARRVVQELESGS